MWFLQLRWLWICIFVYFISIFRPVSVAARSKTAAARLPRSWVGIPPGAWIFVCCECYVLAGRGLCDELITRPEESYRLRCVVVFNQETSKMRRPWPTLGRSATKKKYGINFSWFIRNFVRNSDKSTHNIWLQCSLTGFLLDKYGINFSWFIRNYAVRNLINGWYNRE